MSLSIDTNFVRPDRKEQQTEEINLSKYPHLDMEAYNRYASEKFDTDVKGESFKARCIFAQELEQKGTTVLELYFETYNIETRSSNVFRGKIRNYTKDGQEHQSARMHDFLSLCVAQNPNALNESFEHRNFDSISKVYPNITGLVFFLNIAKTGLFKSERGIYPLYSWKFYNTDRLSQEEVETGVLKPVQFNDDLKWLKGEYEKFLANPKPREAKDNDANAPAQQTPQQEPLPPAVEQTPVNIDDDIPF